MCKYHKAVARDIATNDAGDFDPGKYAVALLAMAQFRIEQYMPTMFNCTGFDPREMVKVPRIGKRSSATERTRFMFICSGTPRRPGTQSDSRGATG